MTDLVGIEHARASRVCWAVVSLSFFALAGTRLLLGDQSWQRIAVLVAAISYLLLSSSRGGVRGGRGVFGWMVGFSAFCAFSAFWSSDPERTVLSAVVMFLAASFGMLAGRRFTHAPTGPIVVFTLVAVAASLMAAQLDDGAAIVSNGYQAGALRGIFGHRNQLGFVAAIGLAAVSTALFHARSRRVPMMLSLALMAYALVRTASATSIVVGALAVLTALGMTYLSRLSPRTRRGLLVLFPLLVLIPVIAVSSDTEAVFSFLGRDSTLTGRTDIWSAAFQQWRSAPLFGLGWDSTWGDSSPIQEQISQALGFRVSHAHNGYLDVLLQVGVVGFLIFAMAVGIALTTAMRQIVHEECSTQIPVLTVAVIFVVLAGSMSESRLAVPLTVALVTYLASLQASAAPKSKDVGGASNGLGRKSRRQRNA